MTQPAQIRSVPRSTAVRPDAAPPLVEIRLQGKQIDGRAILGSVAFTLAPGEVVSVVGPSGCGKSTLLRLAAGLDRDFAGQVTVSGQAPRLGHPAVGLVFQEPRLLPWLRVDENIGFDAGRAARGHPRTAHLLEEVGLAGHAAAYPRELSGGMAQRAALARGLFAQPALLLLDEPFSAVDAITRTRLQDLLLDLVRPRGSAVLLVTHDVAEAAYLSDRVVVLSSPPARLLADIPIAPGHPRDREHPAVRAATAQVLDALGSMSAPATTRRHPPGNPPR